MKYLLFFFSLLLLQSCTQKLPVAKNKTNYQQIQNISQKKNTINQIYLDSIKIKTADNESLSSMIGKFFLKSDTLCFADQQLASVLCYDINGQYLTTHLSRGRGKNEILGLREISNIEPNNIYILDHNWTIYIFSENWEMKNKFRIKWGRPQSYKKLLKNYNADELGIYELEYNGIYPWGKNYLILPITTEHRYYNAYFGKNIRHFYDNSYNIGIIDKNKEMLVKMICTRSPIYQLYNYIPNFSKVILDLNQDTLMYSFQADSLIYKYDLTDYSCFSFGNKGINMQTNYRETCTIEESETNYSTDLSDYGYYYDLKVIPATNIIFRSYRKGPLPKNDGLQIYRGNTLIGDCEVPRNFKVFGYLSPYYYASGEADLENDQMIVYKFKLE